MDEQLDPDTFGIKTWLCVFDRALDFLMLRFYSKSSDISSTIISLWFLFFSILFSFVKSIVYLLKLLFYSDYYYLILSDFCDDS